MPKTKTKTSSTKASKKEVKEEIVNEKIKIEEDSDIESTNDDIDEQSDDEVDETVDEENDNVEEDVVDPETKTVLTFEKVYEDILSIRKDISLIETSKSEAKLTYEKTKKELTSELKKKKSEENKLLANLLKFHKKEITVAKREKKRRRNGANTGGFNKETEVPENLRRFLELEAGTKLARPKVMSLLNQKFIDLGLKKGQDVILDKKTAKKFGLKEDHVIGFTQFQRFIADQYPKETEVNV